MSYIDVKPSVGALESDVIGAQILSPGSYKGKILDIEPAEGEQVFLSLSTDRGLHVECVGVDVVKGFRPGVEVRVEISLFPGAALEKHQNKYRVIDAERKPVTGWVTLSKATEALSGMSVARMGISKLEAL